MAWSSHYKSLIEKRGKQLKHGKLYSAIADKGKQKVLEGKKLNGGGTPAPIKCYKYGVVGYRTNECKSDENKCFK